METNDTVLCEFFLLKATPKTTLLGAYPVYPYIVVQQHLFERLGLVEITAMVRI
jgi:hypothetical protein